MAKFITLTHYSSGDRTRVNIDLVETYWHVPADEDDGISAYTMMRPVQRYTGDCLRVAETPEQIDAMLGVTADPAREEVRWYRYDSMGYATVHWSINTNGFVLIPEGQTVPAGWWRYECTDCDERGKFDRLHRAARGE